MVTTLRSLALFSSDRPPYEARKEEGGEALYVADIEAAENELLLHVN